MTHHSLWLLSGCMWGKWEEEGGFFFVGGWGGEGQVQVWEED